MTHLDDLVTLSMATVERVRALRRKGWSVTAIVKHLFADASDERRADIEATVATLVGVPWKGAVAMEPVHVTAQDKAEEALRRRRIAERDAAIRKARCRQERNAASERSNADARERRREHARKRMRLVRAASKEKTP